MQKLLVAGAIAASLVLAPAAFAATAATTTHAPATAAKTDAKVTKTEVKAVKKETHADCVKQWTAEKKHTKTHAAFMKACMA